VSDTIENLINRLVEGEQHAMSRTLDEATQRLWAAIDERQNELIEIVADLVRHRSQLGQEAEAQAYVAAHLSESGLETESWDLDESVLSLPNAGNSGIPFAGRPNVTATRKGAGGGRSLILNGHVDVVSPEPVEAWSHDPWAAEIVGDKMFGRGAYDMKSGVALNLFLPRLIRDLEIPLAGDLMVHSVIEEECTGNGALAASLRKRADAAIVTEPGDGYYTRAHLGVIWFKVTVYGRSTHVAHAWQGVNAIVKMVPVIKALEALNDDFNTQVHAVWDGIKHPINLNVGVIQGGDWPSTVPGVCTLHCRTSFFPGTSVEETCAKIEEAVASASFEDDWLRENSPVVTYDGFRTSGVIVDGNEPIIQALLVAHQSATGVELNPEVATAVNDMRYYNFAGVPSVTYGAWGGNAHAADEWLDLTSMAPAAKALGALILSWCGVTAD
jgi:acetylornithine deacetylase